MIKSIEVNNYRCFEHLALKDLGRFNVIVGENSSGKTALLEALFFPGCDPQAVFQLRSWRGLQPVQLLPNRAAYGAVWKDLFYGYAQNKIVKINLVGTPENTRELQILYVANDQTPLFTGEAKELAQLKDSSAITPITFRTRDSGGTTFERSVVYINGSFSVVGAAPPNALIHFLPSNTASNMVAVAAQFSELSKQNKEEYVIDALQRVFPQIKNLSVEVSGGVPDLYCLVDGLPEKTPVGIVSNGIMKLLTILLTISALSKGIILIDEIENGIYYKIFPKMWKAVHEFCEYYDVQLFVSTHSEECLNDLLPTMAGHEEKFRLLRLEQTKEAKHTVVQFEGKDFESALETGTEVR